MPDANSEEKTTDHRERFTTAGEITGGVLIAVGFGLFSVALGLIVGGLLVAAGSALASVAPGRADEAEDDEVAT